MTSRVFKDQAAGGWVYVCECGRKPKNSMPWEVALLALATHTVAAHSAATAPSPATAEKPQRYRCLVKGCNPVMYGEDALRAHVAATGHRTAEWPKRSKAGQQAERERNRNGYHAKYRRRRRASGWAHAGGGFYEGDHPFSADALGQP